MITIYSPDTDSHITGDVYYETDTYICVTDGKRQVGGPKELVLPTVSERDGYFYGQCPCGWNGSNKTLRSAAVADRDYHAL